jgi:hypothetical protein
VWDASIEHEWDATRRKQTMYGILGLVLTVILIVVVLRFMGVGI